MHGRGAKFRHPRTQVCQLARQQARIRHEARSNGGTDRKIGQATSLIHTAFNNQGTLAVPASTRTAYRGSTTPKSFHSEEPGQVSGGEEEAPHIADASTKD